MNKTAGAFGIISGSISVIFGVVTLTLDSGSWENSRSYGGDAYTGIQNAAAQTANNVQALADIVKYGIGLLLIAIGLLAIAYFAMHIGGKNSQPTTETRSRPSAATTEIALKPDVSKKHLSENDIADIANETFDFDLLPDFESKPEDFKLNEQWQIAIGCMDSDTIYDRYKNEVAFHPDYRYLCYVELKKRMRGREKKDYLTAVPLKSSDGENESGEDEFFDVTCPYCNKQLSFLKGTEEGLCLNCNSVFKISEN